MERRIVHLDIPDFYATLEELRSPELQRFPLALAEPGPRALIQGVNRLGREEGLGEGMVLSQARRSCKRLRVVPPDPFFYREQHRKNLDELSRYSPLVEGTLPGHYFVDLTGTRRLWGPPPDVACTLEYRLEVQRGLRARIGLASNKLVSRVAANCVDPGDLNCIFPGGEIPFLEPLPVTSLPGVGVRTTSRLADFNIHRIGQLAALSVQDLTAVFGTMGVRLSQLARGMDPNPVLPFQRVPGLQFARRMDRDEIERERLEAALFRLVEEAGWVLRAHNRHPGKFALEIHYTDGVAARRRHSLPPIPREVDRRLFRFLRPILSRLLERRVAVRRMVLELWEFSMPFRQMELFPWEEAPVQEDPKLQEAMDRIRRRFGRQAVSWGIGRIP